MTSILNDDVLVEGTGIAVVAADGTTLFARRATLPVAPASTLKIVVAASSLNVFGSSHRFPTSFVALDAPDENGELHGPLWLVGGGDPLLTSDDLRGGVGALHRLGVRHIESGVVVDDTGFAGPGQNPHWDPDDLQEDYAAPTSAISLDGNTVEFDVAPGDVGAPALVTIEPPNDEVRLDGSVATTSENGDSDLTIDLEPHDPKSGDAIADAFRLDGQIVQGETQKYWKPVTDVGAYVAGAVAQMLAQRAIAFDGGTRTGPAPLAAQTLWLHRSQPLSAIVDEMLLNSNNHSAEQLLRLVGQRETGAGTDVAGVAAERRQLARLGVSREGFRVYDGSGLAPDDRVEPLMLAKLVAAELRSPEGDVFLHALPRVGMEGTVRHHNLNDALGRTRAKSGHIEGVNGLTGTVLTRHHGRVAFAFIVNDPRYQAAAITDQEDRALDALADF
jgi:D-alanyl-D-alanine carboxypeptidase/D-alanyl-D-alanine-endopeptidase (penicillin-binding protein 4)